MASSFSSLIRGNAQPQGNGSKSVDWLLAGMKTIAVLLLLVGVVIVGYPFAARGVTSFQQAKASDELSRHMAKDPHGREILAQAEQYNRDLATYGQPVMGSLDPDTSSDPAVARKQAKEDSVAMGDKRYMSLLHYDSGIMGTVIVPKIHVDLRIYHGTAMSTLDIGAGHLYGSSLPVGGPSTHAVIAAHTGMTTAMMFTRLDEMNKKDVFYLNVAGRKMGYRVDRINVIKPDDESKLKIEPGVDRVTLMTCTPYGVNDHRLLVSGVRDYSLDTSYPDDFGKHVMGTIAGVATGLALTVMGLASAAIVKNHRARQVKQGSHGIRAGR
ncbi:class C sortase [Bifidobacterium sp. ESL0704]|uniref:class C sortase n=1 Tax=Bifidobacterium sp. ESL0704 TaxID=2983219 RepID=UPI0023F973E0|nr:class C sortase [Bifidobacterium sp. ESL0704]WEV52857.1 class C sortase [Bifidobacterium sp. ESL0704]